LQHLDPDLRALQEVRDHVRRAVVAQAEAATWDQRRTDDVAKALVAAAARGAADLARLAVEETGIGRVADKTLKNLHASEGIWRSIERELTVGVIARHEERGVIEIASPIGVVAGIVPTTNPTSTAIGKALISLKGRNAIVISPHPRAKRCIGETVEVMRRAVERAGAPADLVQSLSDPTVESTNALMRHPDVKLILATGGSGLVQAAYSSGKPAFGVGPGNVPVYVDRTADVAKAARWIVASQSFDNATLCCSEQALVLDRPIAEKLLGELVRRGAHLCSPEETQKLERYANRGGHMNPEVVGQDPWRVAEQAGFVVPRSTSLLLAHQGGVGPKFPLSIEILCPLLSVHVVDGWQEGCKLSKEILHHGGLGHTIGLWAGDREVQEAWFAQKPASRIVLNGPTSQGAVGYSSGLMPSMSLGCGPLAGNITSDNISARHLVNIKRVGLTAPDWEARYERDVRRAQALVGLDSVPRGSGLSGDPAMERGAVSATRAAPPLEVPAGGAPRAAAAAPTPTQSSPQAPRPYTSGQAPSGGATATAAAAKPAAQAPRPIAQAIPKPPAALQQGAGCPLGPCRGCPHQDTRTGACKA